jgi:hypothetical protein
MNVVPQEAAEPGDVLTPQEEPEFSQKYSKGELEEMSSRELLDGYPDRS